MKHKDITRQIIGCAYQVYKKLGFGFLESIYKKAMMIELSKINLKVEQENL
jgi:GxxExxY protein